MRDKERDDVELHATYEGWWPLIQDCHEKLLEIDPDYSIYQIKEKFGGLRYYFGSESEYHDAMNEIVAEAERLSEVTCEICGKPGRYCSLGYWMMTRCGDCFAEAEKRRQEGRSPVDE